MNPPPDTILAPGQQWTVVLAAGWTVTTRGLCTHPCPHGAIARGYDETLGMFGGQPQTRCANHIGNHRWVEGGRVYQSGGTGLARPVLEPQRQEASSKGGESCVNSCSNLSNVGARTATTGTRPAGARRVGAIANGSQNEQQSNRRSGGTNRCRRRVAQLVRLRVSHAA